MNGPCTSAVGSTVEELRSGEPGEDGLAEHDFDVDDLILKENLLAAHSRVLGIVRGESPGHDVYPEEKQTRFFFSFGKVDGVNARPFEPTGIKALVDLFTYLIPHRYDYMGADRSSLLGYALGLGASRQWPGGPRVVDGDGVGGEAPEVVVSLVQG